MGPFKFIRLSIIWPFQYETFCPFLINFLEIFFFENFLSPIFSSIHSKKNVQMLDLGDPRLVPQVSYLLPLIFQCFVFSFRTYLWVNPPNSPWHCSEFSHHIFFYFFYQKPLHKMQVNCTWKLQLKAIARFLFPIKKKNYNLCSKKEYFQ